MSDRLARALSFIQECRKTHVDWAAWIRDNPEAAQQPRPQVDIAGSVAEHEECVAGYDLVIELLLELQQK